MPAIAPLDFKEELFWNSLTLDERRGFSLRPSPLPSASQASQIEDRLRRWQENVALKSPSRFENRLQADDLDIEHARVLLSPASRFSLPEGVAFPAWLSHIAAIEEALALPPEEVRQEVSGALNAERPVPFEQLHARLVARCSRALLQAWGPEKRRIVSDKVFFRLQRQLLDGLARDSVRVLQLQFEVFRLRHYTAFDLSLLQLQAQPPTEVYQDFIERLRTGEFLSILKKYPVLARFLGQTMEFWLHNSFHLIQRLKEDWEEIQQTFPEAPKELFLEEISEKLSDPHHHGQTVFELSFKGGFQLIYKPHNLEMENAYHALIGWMNRHKCPVPLRAARVLSRSDYGWMEKIAHSPCASSADFPAFYVQAGGLTALMHLLSGSDFHHENVIASGADLVLVDLEALFHRSENQDEPPLAAPSAENVAWKMLWNSVLDIGLLPGCLIGANGELFSVSALGSTVGRKTSSQETAWKHINTDAMHPTTRFETVKPFANAPFCGEAEGDCALFAGEIMRGFREVYDFLAAHKQELLASDGPLARFEPCASRFIFRPTRAYYRAQAHLWAPQVMTSGIDWQIEAEHIGRSLYHGEQPGRFWPLLKEEIASLIQGDIPIFSTPVARSVILTSEGRTVDLGFQVTSLGFARERLARMDEPHREAQQGFIRHSMQVHAALRASQLSSDSVQGSQPLPREQNRVAVFSRAALLEKAARIGGCLLKQAVHAGGSVTWIGLKQYKETSQSYLRPLSADFYGGTLGIAWFLANLSRQTQEARYARNAVLICESILSPLQNPASIQDFLREMGHGAAGIGGVLFALPKLGLLLNRPDFISASKLLANHLAASEIKPNLHDFNTGAAGTLAGLCALSRFENSSACLQQAQEMGRALLLARKSATPDGKRSWPSRDGSVIAGFAHGSSGIGFALLQLHELAPDPAWIEAVEESAAAENSVFDPQEMNWPDLRPARDSKRPRFARNWCAGSAGLLISRLKLCQYSPKAEWLADRDRAIATTSLASSGSSSLCCGLAGALDALLLAQSAGALVESSAMQNKIQALSQIEDSTGILSPALFQGDAGLGYQCLRLADPEKVPSILWW